MIATQKYEEKYKKFIDGIFFRERIKYHAESNINA